MDDSSKASRRPASRRSASRNRSSFMGEALTGYTPAYLQSSPFSGGSEYGVAAAPRSRSSGERKSFYDGAGLFDEEQSSPFTTSSHVSYEKNTFVNTCTSLK